MKQSSAGRPALRRSAVLAAVAVAVSGATFYSASRSFSDSVRGPFSVANDAYQQPVVSTEKGFTAILAAEAPERLIPDTVFPDEKTSVLWFQGRVTNPMGDTRVSVDGAGAVIRFGADLVPHMVHLDLDGKQVESVAAASDGGFWVASSTAELIRTDAEGVVQAQTYAPWDYTELASAPNGDAWVIRSPVRFSSRIQRADAPAVMRIDDSGAPVDSVGNVVIPADFMLANLASSGYLALTDDVVIYAPFVRDQIIAMSYDSDTLWIAKRGLEQEVEEPRLDTSNGDYVIDYAPVNKGVAIGPDGLLYALSVPGYTVSKSRLDVYDPDTGELLRSAIIDNALPSISVGAEGRVYLLDEFSLLTGVPPEERAAFADFDLETLAGGRMTPEDLRGRVTLINFWASWCGPCRTEMPALDSLQKSIVDPQFQFVTFNEDVNADDARAFIDEYGFEFPVALGRGRLGDTYHYIGLPFTVLVDREGNVVQRWIGFAGEGQIQSIRAVADAELNRGVAMPLMGPGGEMPGMDGMEGM